MWMLSSEMHGQFDISMLEISMNTLDHEVGRCKESNFDTQAVDNNNVARPSVVCKADQDGYQFHQSDTMVVVVKYEGPRSPLHMGVTTSSPSWLKHVQLLPPPKSRSTGQPKQPKSPSVNIVPAGIPVPPQATTQICTLQSSTSTTCSSRMF